MKIQYTHGVSSEHNQKFVVAWCSGRESSHYYYTDAERELEAKIAARSELLELLHNDVDEARQVYVQAMNAE